MRYIQKEIIIRFLHGTIKILVQQFTITYLIIVFGKYMRGINMSKNLKDTIFLLIVYFLLLGLIIIFKYPKTIRDLQELEKQGKILISGVDLSIIDVKKTKNLTSISYLLRNDKNELFVMTSTCFPVFPRYELSEIIPLEKEERYEPQDFYYDITVYSDGISLYSSEKFRFSIFVIIVPLTLFVNIYNMLCYYKQGT